MASLAAVFSLDDRTEPRESTVRSMLSASPHRGTVSKVVGRHRCVVGVSDHEGTSETSVGVDGDTIVAFSGILDNADDLIAGLAIEGANPTPARIVLAAYRKHGEGFPNVLRGAFCGIVADWGRILSFRDQIGFRSLFYRAESNRLYVATEAKQVVAGAAIAPEPDPDMLEHIYFHGYDDSMPCALRGVHRIPKATVFSFDATGVRARRYWDPTSLIETASRLSLDDITDRFDELFERAVSRMVTGEDLISLSGGIDSPAVAAYAARASRPQGSRRLAALSAVYPNFPSVDELSYIREVVDRFQMDLHTYVPEAQPLGRLTEWVKLCDGPVPTISLPHYEEHYRRARELGYRTLLSGELAEFVFALDGFLVSHLVTHRRIQPLWHQLRARRERGSSLRSLGKQVASSFVPTPVTALRWRHRRNGVPAWIDRRKANQPAVDSLVSPSRRWTMMQLSAFEGTAVTMEAEELCQDICRVRSRMPWADVDLWEFFLSLPAEVKFPDAQYKSLVRRVLRGRVPDVILDRRDKTVFDEAILGRTDYALLEKLVADSEYRMPGVDYQLLLKRLRSEQLTVQEFNWAKDLVSVHAFVSMW